METLIHLYPLKKALAEKESLIPGLRILMFKSQKDSRERNLLLLQPPQIHLLKMPKRKL